MAEGLTTGQAAAMCGVTMSTVVRWTRFYGLAYELDHRGFRRIDPAAVKAFVRPASRHTRPKRLCSLGDGRPHYGHGYCRPHHLRWSRSGDPNAGKPIRTLWFPRPKPVRPTPAPKVFDPIDTEEL